MFVFFLAGAFTGSLTTYLYTNIQSPRTIKLHPPAGTYTYIDPTFVSNPVNTDNFSSVSPDLQLKIGGIISASQKKDGTQHIGLYYREFESGQSLAINSNQQFSPGFLLKIPIMVAYYQLAEQDFSVLNKTITFSGPYIQRNDLFTSASSLVVGQSYTVSTLIDKMITGSDDTATALLFRNIDKNVLNEVFSDLGIDVREDEATPVFITIERYATFFRVLYNATYLTPEYSEEALSTLAQTTRTTSLLEKNLPQSIQLISRVGGRKLPSGAGMEIYECNIVYYPRHNYLLCVSGQAESVQALSTLFSNIGAAVYQDLVYSYGQ